MKPKSRAKWSGREARPCGRQAARPDGSGREARLWGRQAARHKTAFRRAVWASVVLHALAACALVLYMRTGEPKPPEPRIDTRAADEPQVRMSLPEADVSIEPPAAPAKPQAAEPQPPQAPEPPPAAPQVAEVAPPQVAESASPLAA